MSLRVCQRMVRIEKFCYMLEIGDTVVNIVRNCIPMRNCMLGERLWSESHFRLVQAVRRFFDIPGDNSAGNARPQSVPQKWPLLGTPMKSWQSFVQERGNVETGRCELWTSG